MNNNPFCAGGLYPAQPWPYGPGCDCCDAPTCEECVQQGSAPDNSADHPSLPCCRGGNCSQCQCIAGDIPWLMPKAIGCGRTHKCGDDVNYPNLRLSEDASHPILAGQLDGCSLPGRPPHTITCVHALGITPRAHPVGTGNVCSDDVNISVDGYDLVLHAEIPLELIVRDCCGYQYCLRSYFYEDIRIPLCVRADPVRASSDYLFLKVRVRLCSPYSVPADVSANASHVGTCTPVPATGQGIPVGANGMRLEVLVEACVVKLVPYGVLGFDPYSCQPPKYN